MTTTYNPDFRDLLEDMLELHERKGHDYARSDNPYSNFEEAAAESGLSVDQVFRVMVAIKNARIRELERSGKDPQNESVQDSYMDRLMYCALQLSYRRRCAKPTVRPAEGDTNHAADYPDGNYGHGV